MHNEKIKEIQIFTGEDSRAPSDRTMSEYMIANERATASTLTTPSHKHRTRRSRSQERPPRAHSVTSHHSNGNRHYDENSDIYITTAAYRPPSEIRYELISSRYRIHPVIYMYIHAHLMHACILSK